MTAVLSTGPAPVRRPGPRPNPRPRPPRGPRRQARRATTGRLGPFVLLAIAAPALGVAVSRQPVLAAAGAVAAVAAAAIAVRPVYGVHALIVVTPLTAGIDRGSLIPMLRPSEALCGLVAVALLGRWLVTLRSARDVTVRIDPIVAALLALAGASSIVPLLWLRLQDKAVAGDDLLYALLMWKFLLVFLIVRTARLDERQTWRALQLSVGAAAVVGVVSLLQTAGWGPVVELLQRYYTNNDNTNAITAARGSSTLGLPIAVADLLTFNLAIVMGIIWLRRRTTPVLAAVGLLLTLGVVGAGEFSGVIGLVIGVIALCVLTRSVFPTRFLLVGGVLAVPVLWPVIETRLAGFQSLSGLPISWTGRLNNLHTYFWPELFSGHRFLLGVRPAARVVAPHRANGFIWIESGYTWLLWAGGIPLLLAFFAFVFVATRAALRGFRSASEARRIAGLATVAALTVISVLMVFDPHLTYRGAADELFVLLALCAPAHHPDPGGTCHE